jgi:hypothetical protein
MLTTKRSQIGNWPNAVAFGVNEAVVGFNMFLLAGIVPVCPTFVTLNMTFPCCQIVHRLKIQAILAAMPR